MCYLLECPAKIKPSLVARLRLGQNPSSCSHKIVFLLKSILGTLTSKHSSWWRRTEDVLKTFSRRIQCNIFCLPRRLEDIIARRLEDIIARRLTNTSWRHFRKTYCKYVVKTSSRRFRKTYCKYVLKTSSRGLGRRKVLR